MEHSCLDNLMGVYTSSDYNECKDRGTTDEKEITSILDELFSTPATSFCISSDGKPDEEIINIFLDECNIPESATTRLSFGEFLTCYDHFVMEILEDAYENHSGTVSDHDDVSTFSWFLINYMKNIRKQSFLGRSFSDINLVQLIQVIIEHIAMRDTSFLDSKEYEGLCTSIKKVKNTENQYTINDFVDLYLQRVKAHWYPADSLEKYAENISYAFICIFFNLYVPLSLYNTYRPDYLSVDEIREKYT